MTPLHILSINDFNFNDSGIYVCVMPQAKTKTLPFIYVLEGIINAPVKLKTGTINQWVDYKRTYIDPVNNIFKVSVDEPLNSFKRNFTLNFKIFTVWENWSECTEIDHQKGIRRKLGRCRIRASIKRSTEKMVSKYNQAVRNALSYLTDGFDIPCRSMRLNKTVPKISKIVKDIPDYQAEEICFVPKKAKHKPSKYKLKSMKQVPENSHVTLSCTEVKPNSDLKWFKEEKLLNSLLFRKNTCKNEEEPRISVDTNNSLHILHISKKEEGNYSCLLNGKTVQEFEVKVLSKAKLLNQGLNKRCIGCRSRGELGTCGDPFPLNVTETIVESGLHVVACPSGWCGKLIEGTLGPYRTDDYGAATERMCLQRAPSDYEERCAYTMWNRKKVYMCFCMGDLCNSAFTASSFPLITLVSILIPLYNYLYLLL
ncbi:unnamed protein product [Chrysodeixis includens]|uniref:Ig-like domain-containing protein n=1 Tax=Chrysodeixis includens TaxID=689277 RepID=A0A9P0C1R7_CHRIL|nr:unnamed protein product [Chrysodeixis includens]